MQQSEPPESNAETPSQPEGWEHGRFGRHAPPWWPEGEAWPPQGPPNRRRWRGMRGHFFRRIGCIFALLIVTGAGVLSVLFWMLANASGAVHLTPNTLQVARGVGVAIVLVGVAGLGLSLRALRRTAIPLGDMLEASGRVADGDYAVRVPERGFGETRELERGFNSMVARLQANDQQRRALLADVTHELRTPIAVIQGSLEGILDGIYPPDKAHIEPILEETRVLSRVIDDLRTLSLAESGGLKLQRETVEPGELVWEALKPFETQAAGSKVTLSAEVQPGLPALDVDPTRIREVLSNLLSNALRYAPPGSPVTVRAWSEGGRAWFAVRDSGAGIADADLPHIFDRFYKSSDSRGTGLGLAIAKNLVAAHGGEISARSQPGQGTEISFWLPIE